MSLNLNVALYRRNAPGSKSNSPKEQKERMTTPQSIEMLLDERREAPREENTTPKDDSMATTTTQKTRKLRKDRMKK